MYIFFFDSRSQHDSNRVETKLERSRDRKFVNPRQTHKEEPKILIGASVPDLSSFSLSIYMYNYPSLSCSFIPLIGVILLSLSVAGLE